MEELDKLKIVDLNVWVNITKWVSPWIPSTTDEILVALVARADGDELWTKFQKLLLAKKREQYEKLRPEWFNHAPKNTQDYRKNLENKANEWDKEAVKEMKFFQWKFAYNEDGSVKLLTLEWGKTFCADLTEKWWYKNWDDAKTLANSKWYRLPTDWNDWDNQADKEGTDWYKLEQYFGDYSHTWALTHMLGCVPGRYWTGTEYKNQKGVARIRVLDEYDLYRGWSNIYNNSRVCGFKDSM